MHFPTDVNLLYDAARKCLQLAGRLATEAGLPGWRKSQYWRKRFKCQCRQVSQFFVRGGKKRAEKLQNATKAYLQLARELSRRLDSAEADFEVSAKNCIKQEILLKELHLFKSYLDKQIDLVSRRILDGDKIPHSEKVFSLFEPYTEWIQKDKAGRRQELGLKLTVATDQFGFILCHEIMQKQQDKEMAVPIANTLLEKYDIAGMSFDKGYWTPDNYKTPL